MVPQDYRGLAKNSRLYDLPGVVEFHGYKASFQNKLDIPYREAVNRGVYGGRWIINVISN